MDGHPANKQRQIDAMKKAGVDPKIGEWPGDPGFEGPTGVRNGDAKYSVPAPTDRELAFDILRTANAFNEAVYEAQKAGLKIEVDTVKTFTAIPPSEGVVLDVRVLRDLTGFVDEA